MTRIRDTWTTIHTRWTALSSGQQMLIYGALAGLIVLFIVVWTSFALLRNGNQQLASAVPSPTPTPTAAATPTPVFLPVVYPQTEKPEEGEEFTPPEVTNQFIAGGRLEVIVMTPTPRADEPMQPQPSSPALVPATPTMTPTRTIESPTPLPSPTPSPAPSPKAAPSPSPSPTTTAVPTATPTTVPAPTATAMPIATTTGRAVVNGHVRNPAGKPVNGVFVSFQKRGSNESSITRSEEGYYFIDLSKKGAGEYDIYTLLERGGKATYRQTLHVEAPSTNVLDIYIE